MPIDRLPRIPRKSESAELRASKRELAAAEERSKSKSASPASKEILGRSKTEPDNLKAPEVARRDPRLRRHAVEKAEAEEEAAPKEKKRSLDKKEKEKEDSGKASAHQRAANARAKLSNGSLSKQEKQDFRVSKAGGKRSRSRSRSRSPSQPKRKERRSPKGLKGTSVSPPKFSKSRSGSGKHSSSHTEEVAHHGPAREDRGPPKDASEARRAKRGHEERTSEPRDSYSSREPPEAKENIKSWRSGWEDSKR